MSGVEGLDDGTRLDPTWSEIVEGSSGETAAPELSSIDPLGWANGDVAALAPAAGFGIEELDGLGPVLPPDEVASDPEAAAAFAQDLFQIQSGGLGFDENGEVSLTPFTGPEEFPFFTQGDTIRAALRLMVEGQIVQADMSLNVVEFGQEMSQLYSLAERRRSEEARRQSEEAEKWAGRSQWLGLSLSGGLLLLTSAMIIFSNPALWPLVIGAAVVGGLAGYLRSDHRDEGLFSPDLFRDVLGGANLGVSVLGLVVGAYAIFAAARNTVFWNTGKDALGWFGLGRNSTTPVAQVAQDAAREATESMLDDIAVELIDQGKKVTLETLEEALEAKGKGYLLDVVRTTGDDLAFEGGDDVVANIALKQAQAQLQRVPDEVARGITDDALVQAIQTGVAEGRNGAVTHAITTKQWADRWSWGRLFAGAGYGGATITKGVIDLQTDLRFADAAEQEALASLLASLVEYLQNGEIQEFMQLFMASLEQTQALIEGTLQRQDAQGRTYMQIAQSFTR